MANTYGFEVEKFIGTTLWLADRQAIGTEKFETHHVLDQRLFSTQIKAFGQAILVYIFQEARFILEVIFQTWNSNMVLISQ